MSQRLLVVVAVILLAGAYVRPSHEAHTAGRDREASTEVLAPARQGRYPARVMRVAYLVNQYPSISHTFVRREIEGLERLGVEVERFSVRAMDPEALPDPS